MGKKIFSFSTIIRLTIANAAYYRTLSYLIAIKNDGNKRPDDLQKRGDFRKSSEHLLPSFLIAMRYESVR